MRDEDEIQRLADKAADVADLPTKFRNMTYEQGVREALDWVLDDSIPREEWPLGGDE